MSIKKIDNRISVLTNLVIDFLVAFIPVTT